MRFPSLRFLASRKFWQRTAFGLACLSTIIVTAYAIENYRGEKAWADYRAEAKARGTKLDFKDFIPPPIPDEENFAAIPIYRELFSVDPVVKARGQKTCELPSDCYSIYRSSLEGRTTPDFAAVRDCLAKNSLLPITTDDAVADVLRALEQFEPTLAQLRAATARPRSRLAGEWEKGFDAAIWRMGSAFSLGKLINLRVSALLAEGRAHEALIDWHAGYRDAGVFQGEPTLLACMLRVMLMAWSTDSIRRGLAERAWFEDELNSIINDLAAVDLMADFAFALSSERALQNGILDHVRANSTAWSSYSSYLRVNPPKWSSSTPIPRGWFAQNQRHLNEWYDQQIAAAIEIPPTEIKVPERWVRFPYWFVVRSVVYMICGNFDICRWTQTNVDLTLVACALERFRLRNGEYPNELRELVPGTLSKLPRDRFDGQALRYRRTDHEQVVLYSVGGDCRDDGGDDAKDVVWRSAPIESTQRNR
ncbi:MAG TPA: hypothetical protein VFD27_21190 [Chthoniobacteraceae bacterium]|jgi:hypothetical protein|nr:hypothetical protein [Chthoniobacteraceae bacterium]